MKSLATAEVVQEVRSRLCLVRAEDQPRWGGMRADQMLGHVGLAYQMVLTDTLGKTVPGPPQWMMKFAALWTGREWAHGYKTTPLLKMALAAQAPGRLKEELALALEGVNGVAGGERLPATHPMFGPMTLKDWQRWGYLHADHHLRQFGR